MVGARGPRGGAGGEATTTSGLEGGEGGGTTTASEGCSPACDEHSACVDGQCAPLRVASLTAWRLAYHGGGGVFQEIGGISVCEEPSAPPPTPEILAEEGDCKVLSAVTPAPEEAPGLSGVVAKAPSFGAITVTPSGTDACEAEDVTITPAFLDGETVTFEAAAGDHNPAFTVAADSPPPLTITPGPLVLGQPLEITWEAGGEIPFVVLSTVGSDNFVQCTPTAGTSVVVGPGIVDAMLNSPSPWTVIGILLEEAGALEVSPTYRARAFTVRYAYVEVPSFQ